ncbi:hypothetical protein SRB5_71380 [Streptomyces sp. RB5]|uniref:Glycolipid-binding domain-containing protein n=1 Tax=Streptomyces smaragdinus TaxID=2585196 RepID=A0A7K0CU85_9ACTN|nr:hypothetical protein [Streptomyces smaragdinus]MQY16933.1 hypothetical protein [Streptomyces smaragdinus]
MPRGRYSLHDPYDDTPLGEEHFQCAPGPTGWRYVSQLTTPTGTPAGSVDLTTDNLGRPIRLELHSAGWQVRGAALDGVTWVRTDASGTDAREGNAPAQTFTGTSPAFLVATARQLALKESETRRIRVVTFAPPVLAPRTLDQSWTLTETRLHESDEGSLEVQTYQVTDLETGEQAEVHLSGDVVLAAPGIELEDLETPPSTFDTNG